jgi:hypothetical protein
MEIQNVTFAEKKHGSLIDSGFREISSRENQYNSNLVRNYLSFSAVKITEALISTQIDLPANY